MPWKWTSDHQHAFNQVKEQIAKDCTTALYDPAKKTRVTVDASPVGLGAILSQFDEANNERIVAYASRSLSKVEKRYSQTEKEALGVVFGYEKFHIYLIGIEFELDTDHKPLEIIYHPKSKPSARIERWALRLQQYQFKLRHRPGKTNPADVLSRDPLVTPEKSAIAEEYVNSLTNHLIPKSMTRQEIETAAQKEPEIQALVTAIPTNSWPRRKTSKKTNRSGIEDDLAPYYNIRNEFTVTANGIVLRGNRIVIPKKLRRRTLAIAHERHQGIVKTKTLLPTKVWWPGIDRQVETLVSCCLHCQAANKSTSFEPLKMTTMPKKPWQVIHGASNSWQVIHFCTTPHTTTGVAHADLLFNRTVRNKLPDVNSLIPDEQVASNANTLPNVPAISGSLQNAIRDTVLQRDQGKKENMKRNADRRNRAKESNLRIGDLVLLKQKQKNKPCLPWHPSPYRISSLKGSRITAQRRGVTVTRNSSHFKRVIPYLKQVDDPYLASSEEEEGKQVNEHNQHEDNDSSNDEDDDQQQQQQQQQQDNQVNQQRRYPRRKNRDNRPQYFAEEGH